LDSVTVEDWGEEIFTKGVGVKWKKWARGRGRKNISSPPKPHQSFTGQAFSYNPRWQHQTHLSSVPLEIMHALQASYFPLSTIVIAPL